MSYSQLSITSHILPSSLVNSLCSPSPLTLPPHYMMCHHSHQESYSLSEWDHNRSSFTFNSQSDNILHVHMGKCVRVFLRLTPLWLHGWTWADVPTGAELPERRETQTLMRWWQNSQSPIKESEERPFKTGGQGRMRNDKDILEGRCCGEWCEEEQLQSLWNITFLKNIYKW